MTIHAETPINDETRNEAQVFIHSFVLFGKQTHTKKTTDKQHKINKQTQQ